MSSPLFMVPGPIDLFATFRDSTTMYIGTCEQAPEVEVRPAWIDIKNDITGRSIPAGKMPDGEQHLIYLTATNRFDWAGYKFMARAAVPGDIGPATLINNVISQNVIATGADDFEFVLRYSLGGSIVSPAQMPVGRRYYSCVLLGARESTVGSKIMSVSMILEANPLTDFVNRTFRLYSELPADVLTGLPALT